MRRKVTLKEVIFAVELSLFPICGWPLPRDATRLKVLCVKLYYCLSIIITSCLTLPLMYGVRNHLDDIPILVQLLMVTSGSIHCIFNFIFHGINSHYIQSVTFKMVHFSSLMKPHEEIVIQRYVDKCLMLYGTSIFCFYSITLLTIALPAVTEQPFPTFAEYPFDVFYQPLKAIIFIHQFIAGMLMSGQLCTNTFMALLIWFASARFEILSEELEKVTNVYQFFKCIRKHQELLEYADEVARATRPFAFTTVCCSTFSVIISFLLFITNQPFAILVQFFGVAVIAITEVFMYTWPAEYLMHKSNNIAQIAFELLENNDFTEIWKCLQIIIMRGQKAITVSIPCIMPALSFNYFAAYLSTILSYFTTLRVMLMDIDEN